MWHGDKRLQFMAIGGDSLMRLYLIQHGDAVSKEVDPQRPLSEIGTGDIGWLLSWLRKADVSVGQILHSGKLRAQQTAEILAPLLEDDRTVQARAGLSPNDSPQDLLDMLSDEDVIVAGHMPFVSRAVSLALGSSTDHPLVAFVPGSVAVLEKGDNDRWCLITFVRPDTQKKRVESI